MVSQKNVLTVKDVAEHIKKFPAIGILDMFKLPASQLQQIRDMLRGKAVIRMVKKRLLILVFKDSGLKGIEALEERIQGEPALVMTDMNPFRLVRLISESKSEAPAKEGDIAPRDITVNAGPTALPPGPVIGELQKAKIPATIEGDKIHVRKDTVVAREGDVIDSLLAGILTKLGIMPMEIGLNLIAVWEKGDIYGKDVLSIPHETHMSDVISAHRKAFNLAFSVGYYTKDNIRLFLGKARQEAHNLAVSAGILTGETVKPLLAKAHAQAEALRERMGEEPKKEPEKEEKPEEPTKEAAEDKDKKVIMTKKEEGVNEEGGNIDERTPPEKEEKGKPDEGNPPEIDKEKETPEERKSTEKNDDVNGGD